MYMYTFHTIFARCARACANRFRDSRTGNSTRARRTTHTHIYLRLDVGEFRMFYVSDAVCTRATSSDPRFERVKLNIYFSRFILHKCMSHKSAQCVSD